MMRVRDVRRLSMTMTYLNYHGYFAHPLIMNNFRCYFSSTNIQNVHFWMRKNILKLFITKEAMGARNERAFVDIPL